MVIKEDFLTINKYSRPGCRRPETLAVVVHWVGNPRQSAKQVRDYFESLKNGVVQGGVVRYASSQYIIDMDGTVYSAMPVDEVSYHCGCAGKIDPASGKLYTDQARALFGTKFTTNPYSPNYVTVGIEMTHPEWNGRFTEETLSSATELIVSLFKKYPRLGDVGTQLIRHKDITGWKSCPKWFCDYPEEFENFKTRVVNSLHS